MRYAFRIARCVVLASVLLPATASAADFDAGMRAYRQGDFATAYDEWLPLAEQGSPAAQFNLGLIFRYGKGREPDPGEATRWFLEAADDGFAPAQYEIAEMYEAGEGVDRNVVQAYKWFKLAAGQKYEDARKRRKKLADRMSPSEIAHGEMWAREWRKEQKEREQAEKDR
jgi:TPR repeat protein